MTTLCCSQKQSAAFDLYPGSHESCTMLQCALSIIMIAVQIATRMCGFFAVCCDRPVCAQICTQLHQVFIKTYQFSCPEPPVPQESISNSSATPDRSTTFLRTASAAGLRQMLPAAYSEFSHLVDTWWAAGSETLLITLIDQVRRLSTFADKQHLGLGQVWLKSSRGL